MRLGARVRLGHVHFIIVVTGLVLAGCAVGPDYKRPTLSPPDKFRGQVTPVEAASVADLPWWEVFGDPTLQALIGEAISGNYDLKIAATRVAQARAQVGIAQAAFFPWIGYNVKVQRSKEYAAFLGISSNQFAPTATNLFLGALSASWEIDVWGAVRRSNEAATAQLLATEEGRRGVLLSLVSDVAQAYFDLIELDARLEIARDTTAAYEGIYRIFKDRLEFGVQSELEVARAEGALASAAATIPELKSQTKLQYEQGVIKAFQDVASNLAALDQLAVAEAELARAVKALKKAVELAEIRYQYGLSSYFEVLDAQEKLFPAQNAQAEVRLNRLVAYVQLYKALGGGWNVKDPQLAAKPGAEAAGAGR